MNRLAVNNAHTRHRGIISRPELIQLITGPADAGSQTHGRYRQGILSHRVVRNVLPQPSEIQQLPHSRIELVPSLMRIRASPFLTLNLYSLISLPCMTRTFFRYLHKLSVPDEYASGIIIFHQIRITIMVYLQYAEGGIGYLPDLADREGSH